MPSMLLDNTHGQTTSSVARHHRPLTAYMIGICRAWHVIISLEKHTPSGNVGHCIPSSPLESIHDRTTSRVAYYHHPITEHMIGPRRAFNANMSLGQHKCSDDVGHGMPSSTFGSTRGWTTLSVKCNLRPWTAHIEGRCRA